jgi:signal transduction histidine kinase
MVDYATLLASAVHDMKNSLGVLMSSIEELQEPCSACQVTHAKRERMSYEAQRLNSDLLQLLAIYKIDTGRYQANIQEQCVADFLSECALTHAVVLGPRGFTIEQCCDPGLYGYFDRHMVAGVINNVINNAYKYSKDTVRLSAQFTNEYLVISVEDNGPGYPDIMLCNTQPTAGPIDFEKGSTSLGLYFSSLIAALHTNHGRHGYIECSNDGIDGGGRFALYLP